MNYSYRTHDVYGYGRQEGDFNASSDSAAQKMAWEKIARAITSASKYKDLAARVAKAKSVYTDITLYNMTDSKVWEWSGSDGWETAAQRQAKQDEFNQRKAEDKKRGYRMVDGLALPPEALVLEPVIDGEGNKPEGSSGYATLLNIKGDQVEISDGTQLGRVWPAVWDIEKKAWRVVGDGRQYKEGKVVETFPVGKMKAEPVKAKPFNAEKEWEPKDRYGLSYKRAIELGEDPEYPRIAAAVFRFDQLDPDEQREVIRYKKEELADAKAESKRIYKAAIESSKIDKKLNISSKGLNPYPQKKKDIKERISRLERQISDFGGKMKTETTELSKKQVKEPWEMTKADYLIDAKARIEQYGAERPWAGAYGKFDAGVSTARHELHVKQAISEGKPVPPEVLKDYPELADDAARKVIRGEDKRIHFSGPITESLRGIRGIRLAEEETAKKKKAQPETPENILNTPSSFMSEKFGLPTGKAMPRTKEQSDKLIRLAQIARKHVEGIAMTDSHPGWKPVRELEGLMTDAEFERYFGSRYRAAMQDTMYKETKEKKEKLLAEAESALKTLRGEDVKSTTSKSDLQSIEDSRSPLSRSMDESRSNLDTIESDDPRTKTWMRDPGSMDIEGIDTPKSIKKARKKPSQSRKTRPASQTTMGRVKR